MSYLQKTSPTLQRGFTFAELIIVATIISVLAAIAMPSYNSYLNRAKATEVFSLSSPARYKIAEFYRQTGSLPTDNRAAGLPEPKQLNGKYIQYLQVDHGVIVLQFKDNIGEELSNQRLSIHPKIVVASPTTPLTFYCCNTDTKPPTGIINVGKQQTTLDDSVLRGICQ